MWAPEASMVDELDGSVGFLRSDPQGAGDFADVAWVVAQAFGNGPGVDGLQASRSQAGHLHVFVAATGPEYVRAIALRFGWDAVDAGRPGWYLATSGTLGQLLVSVTWVGSRPDPAADAGLVAS